MTFCQIIPDIGYNIVAERNLHEAAARVENYLKAQKPEAHFQRT